MVTSESFSTRVTRLAGALTPNQLKAARYFRQNATMTLTSSTSLIASKVGVSTASVIRTAQSLGYAGFPELKQALADELSDTGTEPRKLIGRRVSARQAGRNSLMSVIEDSITTLDEATTTIDRTVWDEAVGALAGASETFTYGVEEAGHLAEIFAHHMRTFGFKAQANRHTGRSLAPFVTSLGADDCIVLFAPLRVFPEIKEIFAYAKDRSIRTILVTEIVDTSFANDDSLVLATPSTVLTDTENIMAPLVVAFSLAHDVANRSSSSSMDAYNEMVERRERL
ncbi:MurR/RpiR family transcriptional regulator [Brevibacterium sp. UCMA 11754]|uniref:MurR/RpiR family transcriptional regulator n=1 Tax=Brevibacterium sp. UCMA 11754 TaxID=2749198 RepID=UPI0022866FDE|nr:MurR/RpiR family transcriptional regulator [Brevibacterium sp. UCMA 11754]MCF2573588.1 MurR/RpiR family transcriptional regulator [Brevibacterium sp. UCMA 11754]